MTENFNDFSNLDNELENAFSGEATAQEVVIPSLSAKPEKSSKGIKVFCLLLAALLLVCSSWVGGYFFGKYNNFKRQDNSQVITLQPKPSNKETLSSSEIYEKVANSVVGILVYNDEGIKGEASGVVFSQDGLILTNDHIYSTAPSAKFKIFMHDGTEYNAYYLAGDTRSDLALLKISEEVNLTVPEFGNSDEVVTGESVCVIGCPNGYDLSSTLTVGIVSVPKVRMAVTTSYTSNFIQTDAAINPGNSGGALVNAYGQVIGITACKLVAANYEGVGYAIPTKTVQKIAGSLAENGNVKNRAKLGISYYAFNSANAEIQGLETCGLIVDDVSKESTLFGRVKKGDIITHINGTKIIDDFVLLDILEECLPGDTVDLTVLNELGKMETYKALLLNDEGSSSYVMAPSKTK